MKKILYILAIGTALLMTSCKDSFFDLERPVQYPWQTVDELALAVRAPYLQMFGAAWTNPMGMLPLRGFAESDIAMYTGATGDSYFDTYNRRAWKTTILNNSKELEGGFQYCYEIITTTNAALKLILDAEAAKKDPFTDMTDADRARVEQYKGELLFMRAVAYWYLARTWAPPYNAENVAKKETYFVVRTNYETELEKLKNTQLATLEEIYTRIVTDFKDAVAALPAEYDKTDGDSRMRANKFAAEAMLARVLFYMGKFDEAKPYLDDVIKQTQLYDLTEEPYQAWNRIWGKGYGKEVIWELCSEANSDRYDRNPGIFNAYAYNTKVNKQSGYIAFAMSYYGLMKIGWMEHNPSLVSETNPYGMKLTDAAGKDKRFQQLYQYVEEYSGVKIPLVFLFKYFRGETQTSNAERRANRPIIRLADLYIMRAEINWLAGKKEDAAKDLNKVRERAGLDAIDFNVLTENDIENERIKEMAGENADRIFWLQALHKDIPVGDRTFGEPIKYPYSDYYYNIPEYEKRTNAAYQTNN